MESKLQELLDATTEVRVQWGLWLKQVRETGDRSMTPGLICALEVQSIRWQHCRYDYFKAEAL